MKKLIFISSLFLVSCGGKKDLQSIEWRKGESLAPLQSLSEVDLAKPSKLQSLHEVVEFREQSVQGIAVENSFVKNLRGQSGEEVMVRASISLEEEKLNKLKLEEFAQKKDSIAKELLAAFPIFRKFAPEKIETIIAHRRGFYEPLWRVVYSDQKGVPWEVRLNNHLQVRGVKRVGSQFHDTVAYIFPKGPKKSQIQEVVLKGLMTQPTLSNSRLLVSSQASAKIVSVTDPLKFNPQDSRFDQVQVFYFLEESLKWFENRLNIKIPFQIQAEVHVGAPDKTNSAFYYQGKIRIGAGDDETYSRIPQDPSIVIHESVHALVDAVARLPYEGEGGSLNEAFADFFTALQLNNPNMGEAAYLKGPFRRSLVNDYKLSDKNGGLYHDSGIVSGTLWSLSTRLGAEKGRQLALLTLNRMVPSSDLRDFGLTLRDVLPLVLSSEEDLDAARAIVTERGF